MRFLLIPLLLCSCTSLPAIVDLPGGGFVRARTPEIAERFAEQLLEYEPNVIRVLGTENTRNPILFVRGTREDGGPDGSVRGWTSIHPTSIHLKEDADGVALYHELVHWHAVGPWDRLSLGIEEGMATLIAHELENERRGITILPPEPELAERVLTLDPTTWKGERSEDKYAAAAWVYAAIGQEKLWELACRAEEQGLASIPRDWIQLPPLEEITVRHMDMRTSGTASYLTLGE